MSIVKHTTTTLSDRNINHHLSRFIDRLKMKTVAVLSVLSLTASGVAAFAPTNTFQSSFTHLRMSDEAVEAPAEIPDIVAEIVEEAAPAAAAVAVALPSVFDEYVGNVDYRGREFNFDPVSFYGIHYIGCYPVVCALRCFLIMRTDKI